MREQEFTEAFINHIKYDKQFLQYILKEYPVEINSIGSYIALHQDDFSILELNQRASELIDFLDGNGFSIEAASEPYIILGTMAKRYIINIIYEENENEEEKEQPIIVELPLYEEILSYTSTESFTQPILEPPEFLAPREIRVCIHGCMEFLRMVPASWCGGSTLSRPP